MPTPDAQAPPREDRRSRRRRELHAHIFETARSLFLAHGFEATTVEQIAEAADIAQATFFNHFPSKEHVLREMAAEVFIRVGDLVSQQRKRQASTRSRLRGFAARGARVIEGTPELTRRVLLEVLRTTAPAGEAGAQLVGLQGYFAELIRDGQAQGDVIADDPEFLADMLAGVMQSVILRWINDPTYPLALRMRRAAAFVGDALTPEGE